MREIVTLQLGTAANHASAHLWNALLTHHDSAASSQPIAPLLFNPTNNPHTVIVDFKDEIGSLNTQNTSQTDLSTLTWAADRLDSVTHLQHPHVFRDCQTANSTPPPPVHSWSDFLLPELSHRSLALLPRPLSFGNPQCGIDVCHHDWVSETVLDTNLRYFFEQADHPAGLNIVADGYGGWAGVASTVIEAVTDHFPKLSCLANTLVSPSDAIASAHLTGSLMSSSRLVQNVISVPNGWTQRPSAHTLYQATATLSPLFFTTLAPIIYDSWSLADFADLLVAANPACPLAHAQLFAPFIKPLSATPNRIYDAFFFQPNEHHWFDFAVNSSQPGIHRNPTAEAWIELNCSSPGIPLAAPQWTPFTDRVAEWYGGADCSFPRLFPFPYPGNDSAPVTAHYLSGPHEMSHTINWMVNSIQHSIDPELKECLLAMILDC